MSKVLQKKNHWINKVNDCALILDAHGEINVELLGGAEHGEFAYIGQVREDAAVYQDGKLSQGELVLEVEGVAVSGLPLYDIYTVIKSCQGPVRLKTVRQGKRNVIYRHSAVQFVLVELPFPTGSCFITTIWHNITSSRQNGHA